jgi:hypothetical protein
MWEGCAKRRRKVANRKSLQAFRQKSALAQTRWNFLLNDVTDSGLPLPHGWSYGLDYCYDEQHGTVL